MMSVSMMPGLNMSQPQVNPQLGPNFLKAAHQELVGRQKTMVQTMPTDLLQQLLSKATAGATQGAQQSSTSALNAKTPGMGTVAGILGGLAQGSNETPPAMPPSGGNPTPPTAGGGGGPGGPGQPQSSTSESGSSNTDTVGGTSGQEARGADTTGGVASENGIDWMGGIGAGLMAGGAGLQGKDPSEVLNHLMQTKLAQQKMAGKEPMQLKDIQAAMLAMPATEANEAKDLAAVYQELGGQRNPLYKLVGIETPGMQYINQRMTGLVKKYQTAAGTRAASLGVDENATTTATQNAIAKIEKILAQRKGKK